MSRKINLFVVDDETNFTDLITKMLPKTKYNLKVFGSGREVLKAIAKESFDVGLIDIRMPGMNGIELLKKLRKQDLLTEFIILTGYAEVSSAITAMKLGAYDYLTKPIRISELELVIQKAYEKKAINKENLALKEELRIKDKYHEMVGKSAKIKSVFSLIDKVAKTSSLVLVTGESGTGKELVARAIHKNSPRKDKPFIVVDCTAIPETLLESELFGHEKGAFTHAISLKQGLFETADQGTLFIDEIGETNPNTQGKLLRAIETHQFRRLGSNKSIQMDARIIASTNRDLTEEVKQDRFRKDLYYRINVVNINLPPLRERKEDIPRLVKYFLSKNQGKITPEKKISSEAIKILMGYDWPGNVRELVNVIERALIVSINEYISPIDLPTDLSKQLYLSLSDKMNLSKMMSAFEKNLILKVLQECGSNKIKTAQTLNLSRSKLYRKLKEHHIK